MNIFMLAINNIKKSKSTAITLIILIMLSTVFLYIGSKVILEMEPFYNNKAKALKDANISVTVKDYEVYKKAYSLIKNNSHVKKVEVENVIFYPASFRGGKSDISVEFIMCDAAHKRTLSNINLIEKDNIKTKNGIIVSYNLKAGYGYKLGDNLVIKSNGKKLTYKIYGFYEDTLFNNLGDTLFTKVYLFHNNYEKLRKSLSQNYKYKMINASTDKIQNAHLVRQECFSKLSEDFAGRQYAITGMDSGNARDSLSQYIGIFMAILIGFSLILVSIALIVIGFSIVTYIGDNIKNIGVLQAIGYVNNQVIGVSLLQFMIIAFAGSAVGLIAAFLTAPIVSQIVSSLAGMKWPENINPISAGLSIFIILFLVLVVTYLSARKIRKITPIIALRVGVTTHNFKKNHIKLDGCRGNLSLILSIKTLLNYLRQNCIIVVIVFILTFVSIFSAVIYYNFVINDKFIINSVGVEKMDISVEVFNDAKHKLVTQIYNDMLHNNKVRKLNRLWDRGILLNNENTRLYICEDYKPLEVKTVYSGRSPVHDNEVVISNFVAKTNHKKIGDIINITADKMTRSFLVVGLSQHMTGYGRSISITEGGYRRFYHDFKIPAVGIYLKNSSNSSIKSFIKMLNKKYGSNEIIVSNYNAIVQAIVGPFKSPIKLLFIIFVTITVTVVCLILLLIIRIRLSKERRSYGISKALGYTTAQLVFQMVFSLMPVIIIGDLIGALGGCSLANSLMAAILSIMGIYNCNLLINYTYVGLVVAVIIVMAYVFSNVVAYKIRNISPYELMDN